MPVNQLLKPAVQQFIRDHERDDPATLMLRADNFPQIPMRKVVAQIQARQKAKHKFPEWYQMKSIVFPPILSVEQASSELAARYKAKLVSGKHLLDLTGGMGVDTFYLGQSFEKVDYVEQQENLVEIARHNFTQLKAQQIRTRSSEANSFLKALQTPVDCIYIDPARRDDQARKVYRLEDCSPDVIAMRNELLEKSRQVLIKTAPLLDIAAAVRDLQNVSRVWVIAVNQECKEVLYLLEPDFKQELMITAVHLQQGSEQDFTFSSQGETSSAVEYAEPEKYIYEPNAAILKAGAFKSVAVRYHLKKLHPNSHLYTSEVLKDDFPGRIFCTEAICKYSRKAVKQWVPGGKANISTRNFPDSVQQVRKKTGLNEGGSTYIFATTGHENKLMLLICKKES